MKILITAPNNRPDFRQVVALLNFEHFDSDGDSDNAASRTWTWLHLQNRDEPGEFVDIYPNTESPLIFTIESDHRELAAAVAFYLATFMHGEVRVSEDGAYMSDPSCVSGNGVALQNDTGTLRLRMK